MEKIKNTLLSLMIFVTTFLQAQTDTLLSYYPMSIGNMWQYKLTHYKYSLPITEQYYTVTIQGDTIIDGKVYQIFNSTLSSDEYRGIYPSFQRIDSSAMIVFGYDTSGSGKEYIMDSLLTGQGSLRYRFIDDKFVYPNLLYQNQTEFGDLRNVRSLESFNIVGEGVLYSKIHECREIGITWSESGVDDNVWSNNDYWFRDSLVYAKIANKEYGTIASVKNKSIISTEYELNQNYPNPFNPTTTIQFEIPKSEFVQLIVYDIQGRVVSKLVDTYLAAGNHRAFFNGTKVSSGMYFYQIITNEFRSTRKMVILK